ncbi:polyprenyl synthetase family protein [Streptomyces decoyicus]|uniref:polyprenyl synthetase family protein n=1 Tax=Streptomyces decoyicus TaxID=249567 RepID=UPI00386A5B09|nr:polyprenyl synthetase family protein [Streptomyces decoyicus]
MFDLGWSGEGLAGQGGLAEDAPPAFLKVEPAGADARWGDGMAILSGDYTMIRASGLLAQLGRREALLLADLGCLMAEGMVAEMLERFDVDRSEEAALAVVTNKTATLMSGSCAVGDLQGCRDDACIDAMLGFGRHFGIGYQLLDDLLDLTATAEQLGKPVGNDIREGIYTLPLLRALQRDPALRPLLRPEITDAEIAEVLGRVRTGEAVEKVLTLVAQHVDQAVTTSVRPTAPAPVPVSQQRSRTSPAPSSPARP